MQRDGRQQCRPTLSLLGHDLAPGERRDVRNRRRCFERCHLAEVISVTEHLLRSSVLGPRLSGQLTLQLLQFLKTGLGLSKQARIGDGVRQLIRHGLQYNDVLITEGRLLRTLDGHGTDDFVPADKRQSHLGVGRGQEGIIETHSFLAHIQRDAGLPVGYTPADHGLTADL